jgi:heme/copper-type cytochrome/quinol oxidase subunit 3
VIPYTIDARADTGVTNVTMGIWLFLASEVMLFGALFSAYALLRTAAPAWPSGRATLQVPIGALNTVVLMTMTACMWRARSRSIGAGRRLLGWCAILALVFLALKALEYTREIHAGMIPAASTFLATYFLLTGVHALHVAGGAMANLWTIAGASGVGEAMTAGRVRALSLYWAFVDAVWLVIFGVVYLS